MENYCNTWPLYRLTADARFMLLCSIYSPHFVTYETRQKGFNQEEIKDLFSKNWKYTNWRCQLESIQ